MCVCVYVRSSAHVGVGVGACACACGRHGRCTVSRGGWCAVRALLCSAVLYTLLPLTDTQRHPETPARSQPAGQHRIASHLTGPPSTRSVAFGLTTRPPRLVRWHPFGLVGRGRVAGWGNARWCGVRCRAAGCGVPRLGEEEGVCDVCVWCVVCRV